MTVTHWTRIMRGATLAALIVAAFVVASVTVNETKAQAPPDAGLAAILGDPARLQQRIKNDIGFREALNFRTDRQYVAGLYADLGQTTGDLRLGGLFTPEEATELQARLALEDDLTAIDSYFRATVPEEFGGVYLDHEGGGFMTVLTVAGDHEAAVRGIVQHADRLAFRQVATSLAVLDGQLTKFNEATVQGSPAVADVVEAWVDVPNNRLVLGVTASTPADVRARLREAFGGPSRVTVIDAQPAELLSLANDPATPPVQGGHSFGTSSSPSSIGTCTLGFEVNRAGLNFTAWFLTAGHCLTGIWPSIPPISFGTPVYHAGAQVGTAGDRFFGGNLDFGLIQMTTHAAAEAKVFWFYPNELPVVGTNTAYIVGQARCWTGKVSSTVCGTIEATSVTAAGITDTVRLSGGAGLPGDSGAPVFLNRWPNTDGTGIAMASGGGKTFYVKWTNIPGIWNVTMETS